MRTQRLEEKREPWPFGSSFYIFFPLPPGPALCKLSQPGVLFVLPEVLTQVLRPSFDLPLFYFRGLFPSLSFSYHHFGLVSYSNYLTKVSLKYIPTFQMLLLLLSYFSCVQLCATPQTVAHQAPPSLGFSRQEQWSGLPFPSPMHQSEK